MKYKVGTVIEFKTPDRHGIGEIVEVNTGSNKKSYLVKLLGKSAGTGHKGNGKSKEKYKTNDYWFVRENGVISIANPEEIHITRKGNEVHAVLKSGGQVVDRAKAVCSPDDEFDFWIGSSLAFSRLIAHTCENTKADPEPEYVEIMGDSGALHCFEVGDVCKVVERHNEYVCVEGIHNKGAQIVSNDDIKTIKVTKRAAKSGEYIMLVKESFPFNEIGDVLKVNHYNGDCAEVLPADHPERESLYSSYVELDGHWNYTKNEYVVLEGYEPPKKFVPHLENIRYGENYGTIGEKTPMKDVTGKTLYVGDTVILINKKSGFVYDEHHYVVKSGMKYFIMGIEACCHNSGEIDGYLAVKQKSYKDLSNGLEYNGIKAVLKE